MPDRRRPRNIADISPALLLSPVFRFSLRLFFFPCFFFPTSSSPTFSRALQKRARYLWVVGCNSTGAFCTRAARNRQLSPRSAAPYIHLPAPPPSSRTFPPMWQLLPYILLLCPEVKFVILFTYVRIHTLCTGGRIKRRVSRTIFPCDMISGKSA